MSGVVPVQPEDDDGLVTFVERYDAKYYARDMILIPEDLEMLKEKPAQQPTAPGSVRDG